MAPGEAGSPPKAGDVVVVAAEDALEDGRGGRQVDHRGPDRIVQQLARGGGSAIAVAVRQAPGLECNTCVRPRRRDRKDVAAAALALASRNSARRWGSRRFRTTTKPSRKNIRAARSTSCGSRICTPCRPFFTRSVSRSAPTSGSSYTRRRGARGSASPNGPKGQIPSRPSPSTKPRVVACPPRTTRSRFRHTPSNRAIRAAHLPRPSSPLPRGASSGTAEDARQDRSLLAGRGLAFRR